MKKIMMIAGSAALVLTVAACGSSSGGGSGNGPTTVAGKMSSGIGNSVTTIQSMGGAMDGAGTFNVNAASARAKCTEHADPADDADLDGVGEDSERLSVGDNNYALQKFYCLLASETDGPESISGSVNMIKNVVCAVEKQIGTLAFDGVNHSVTGLTLTTQCFSQAQIEEMGANPGDTSVTMNISGGLTITSSLNPTFAEIPSNTHYSHGIRIVSNDGTSLKYIIVAKFNSADSDPIESGNFEFATLGTGTLMQGTAVEYTAGKISGGAAATKHLVFESRVNRIKSSLGDALCRPGEASGSCGFSRHARFSTDISFSGGDISDVSNMSGIMTDSGDATGSGNSDHMEVITVNGSISTGLTGKIYRKSASPAGLTVGTATLANTFVGMGETGATTCIMSAGSPVTTACGGSAAVLAPTGLIKNFLMPANDSTWFANLSTHGGLGYSGATTFDDGQFATP